MRRSCRKDSQPSGEASWLLAEKSARIRKYDHADNFSAMRVCVCVCVCVYVDGWVGECTRSFPLLFSVMVYSVLHHIDTEKKKPVCSNC